MRCASWPWTDTNFFPSRKTCCEGCATRRVREGGQELTEYYHAGVVAHLIGFDIPVVLDVEMIGPHDSEIAAARRLFARLVQGGHGRFFNALTGDALYFESKLLAQCRERGKHLLAVLKKNNPSLLADAQSLMQGEPDLVERDALHRSLYWDIEGFRTDAIDDPVRVVHARERRTRRERIAGKWVMAQKDSIWYWATSIPRSQLDTSELCRIGHRRWDIENRVFGALGQHWGLDHCYCHEPTAILNFILLLLIAFTLVGTFSARNLNPALRRQLTLIGLTRQLCLGIVALASADVAWLPLVASARRAEAGASRPEPRCGSPPD